MRIDAMWSQIPVRLRYDQVDICTFKEKSDAQQYVLMLVYCFAQYSQFLLLRKLAKHTQRGRPALYRTSRNLLSTVQLMISRMDRVPTIQKDHSWIVSYKHIMHTSMSPNADLEFSDPLLRPSRS
jgi:hypothetical protein